jgi:hypothetical protein
VFDLYDFLDVFDFFDFLDMFDCCGFITLLLIKSVSSKERSSAILIATGLVIGLAIAVIYGLLTCVPYYTPVSRDLILLVVSSHC